MNDNKARLKEWDVVIVDRSNRVRKKDSKYAFRKGVITNDMSGLDDGNWRFTLDMVSKVIGNAKKNPELLEGFVSKDRLLKELENAK